MHDLKTALVEAFGMERLTVAADARLHETLVKARRIEWKQDKRRQRRAARIRRGWMLSSGVVLRPIK